MNSGAVIITYNPKISDLQLLLTNICNSVSKVVFVDNNSSNIEAIESLLPGFKNLVIIKLAGNMGIGYAQNTGIKYLFNDSTIDAVVLFDHDSLPEAGMIEALKEAYLGLVEKNIKVAAVGPVFTDPRTKNRYPIPVYSGFRLHKVYPKPGDDTPILTSFLIASGSLILRDAVADVGYMNEVFFIDYIDIEWSFRVQKKGYSLYTCPTAIMEHQVGDDRLKIFGREISVHSPLRRYYLARNSLLMLRIKHISWTYKVREVFYTFSRVIVFLLLVPQKRVYLKYIVKGWKDGLRGKTGSFYVKA